MNENIPVLLSVGSFLHAVGQLLLLVISVILFLKQKSFASILMLLGISFSVLFGIGGFVMLTLASKTGPEAILRIQGIFSIINGISHLVFAIGVLLLILTVIKKMNGSMNSAK
ncbi:hypothetical protein [Spongiimicrobium sp. 3-5]|uniref:hypothetical protein n=1 Tax=Spongiimicrobium sp. 3-5 TaxID=3332596 RepID=UPI00397F22C3